MIPYFNDDGYLPPGIHPATLEEIAVRFGQESELRQAQMQSLRWLVDLAVQAGVQRIVVNGSFVTDKLEPNDVDCVLLIGSDFPGMQQQRPNCLPVCRSSIWSLSIRKAFGSSRKGPFRPIATWYLKAWWRLSMSIENKHQLENTRMKLLELEQLYQKTREGPTASEHVRELTLRSLKKRINQFKEEITRFEARVSSGPKS